MKKSVLLSAPLLVFALTCLPPGAPDLLAGNQQGPAWNQAKAKNRQKQQQQAAPAQPQAEKPKRRWFSKKQKQTPAAAENGQPDTTLLPGGSGNGDIPPPDFPPGADLPPPSAAPAPQPASALKTPHERFVPSEELLDQALTGAGPVDEDGLILLAIKNSYRLSRLRAEVAISQARKKGAHALPNPELRIGYVTDRDTRLMRAYTERSTERIDTRERFNSYSTERNLAPDGLRGFGNFENERELGTESTTRYRTIESRVSPGRRSTTVDRRVYESRTDTQSSRTSVRGQDEFRPEDAELAGSQRVNRDLVERSRETIHHPDEYSRDDEISLLMRFELPNPRELHARIQVAAAEIARAESEYLIEEDRVILEVRERFEELLRLESRVRTRGAIRRQAEKGRTEIEGLNDPELADLASDLRLDVSGLGLDIRKIQGDIRQLREELAVLCGLNNPNRIRLPDRLNRRTVNAGNLNVDYLTSLALLHRSDVLDLHARRQLAQAQLKEANALKIPVASFFDVGWARATTERRTGENEEFLVRMGITIPFFDWIGVNQTHKEFKTAAAVYERQIGDRQRLISVEIEQAIGRIRRAEQELGSLEGELKQLNASAERSLRETSDDLNDSARAKYKINQLRTRFDEERFETWSEYNKAVMDLERALGCRLEKALSSSAPLPK